MPANTTRERPLRPLTDQSFDAQVAKPGVTVVAFHAPWCLASRLLLPVMAELATELAAEIGEAEPSTTLALLDHDTQRKVSQRLRIDVLPTVVVFREGAEIARVVAPTGKRELRATLAALAT